MPTLNEKMELGAALFSQPKELGERRVYGTATAASSGGSVSVDVGGEVITVPTIGAVASGQEVVIEVQNGHPVALGVSGWGDDVQTLLDDFENTLSYVWLDQYGQLRITPEPQDQNPTTGVTINANGTEIVGDLYTTTLTDDGLTLLINGLAPSGRLQTPSTSTGQRVRLIGRDGFVLAAPDAADFGDLLTDYRVLVMYSGNESVGPYTDTSLIVGKRSGADGFIMYHPNAAESINGVSKTINTVIETLAQTSGLIADYAKFEDLELNSRWINRNAVPFYGTCSTAAGTQAKAVTCAEFIAADLAAGTLLTVKFDNAQSYNGSPTLNVNGTGAQSVYRNGTNAGLRYMWLAGEVVQFVYDGSAWYVVDGGIATTTYYGVTKLSSSTSSTSTSLAATPSAVKAAYDLAAAGGTDSGWVNVTAGGEIKARTVGKMMTVKAIGYTTDTTSGWATVGTLPASVTQTMRFLACKYSDGTIRRGEIDGNTLKLHQPGTAIGVEFTVTVPIN